MTENRHSAFTTNGVSITGKYAREENDFYETDPRALEELLKYEKFSHNVWECACGRGALSEVLIKHGYNVLSTDLIDRGYGQGGIDFLDPLYNIIYDGDIITNPPYALAKEFVEHALDISMDSAKVAMFLKIQFLESKKRYDLFKKYPPKKIYVFVNRVNCGKNGVFGKESSAVCYAWFIWEKGYTGYPMVDWIS